MPTEGDVGEAKCPTLLSDDAMIFTGFWAVIGDDGYVLTAHKCAFSISMPSLRTRFLRSARGFQLSRLAR